MMPPPRSLGPYKSCRTEVGGEPSTPTSGRTGGAPRTATGSLATNGYVGSAGAISARQAEVMSDNVAP